MTLLDIWMINIKTKKILINWLIRNPHFVMENTSYKLRYVPCKYVSRRWEKSVLYSTDKTVIKVCLQLENKCLLSQNNYSQDLFDPVQANPQISYWIERQSVNIILNTILISGICIVRIVDVSAKKDDQPQCHLPRSWCGSQNKRF